MQLHTTTIEPPRGRFNIDLAEIWSHRELLYFLTLRDIKVRYKQTAIGVFWVILQPLLTAAIFSLIFSTFVRIDPTGVPYPVFALSGILLWLFVFTSVTMASNSLVGNTNLVTKIYFPRLIVPISSTLACVFDLLVSLPLLVAIMLFYRVGFSASVLVAPLFLILAFIQAAAIGMLFSALNVRFRDVKFALPFVLQVWMIASPVFYPASTIPEKFRFVFAINPLAGTIEGWRSALFGLPFDWPFIAISCISTLAIVILAVLTFRQMEDSFADVI